MVWVETFGTRFGLFLGDIGVKYTITSKPNEKVVIGFLAAKSPSKASRYPKNAFFQDDSRMWSDWAVLRQNSTSTQVGVLTNVSTIFTDHLTSSSSTKEPQFASINKAQFSNALEIWETNCKTCRSVWQTCNFFAEVSAKLIEHFAFWSYHRNITFSGYPDLNLLIGTKKCMTPFHYFYRLWFILLFCEPLVHPKKPKMVSKVPNHLSPMSALFSQLHRGLACGWREKKNTREDLPFLHTEHDRNTLRARDTS